MTAGDDPRRRDYAGANLEHWNTWTEINEGSAFYDVEAFLVGRQTCSPSSSGSPGQTSAKAPRCSICSATSDSTRSRGPAWEPLDDGRADLTVGCPYLARVSPSPSSPTAPTPLPM